MKIIRKYQKKHIVYSLLMSLLLIWLTISLPFVYQQKQNVRVSNLCIHHQNSGDEANDLQDSPFNGTTEEKTETSVSIFSEFLPESANQKDFFCDGIANNRFHQSDLYIAFHGELLSPPPEI